VNYLKNKFLTTQSILILLLFSIIAITILSPIASNNYLPTEGDFKYHVAAIVEATNALHEKQFPIRIAPWQSKGLRNPFFQFYSPLPFTIAAVITLLGQFKNTFISYQVTLFGFLIFAAVYMFRLSKQLTSSTSIGILTGIVYITAPYLLININNRGDFTEAIAQCLIPALVYYNYVIFKNPFKIQAIFLCILCWTALILSHMITFVYTSLFLGLFFIILTSKNSFSANRLFLLGFIYVYSLILTAWFLVPILTTVNKLNINSQIFNPYQFSWLTTLPSLFSIAAVSPRPSPTELKIPLYLSIGWPILFAISMNIFFIFQSSLLKNKLTKTPVIASLIVIFIAIVATWSPINFWSYLPKYLTITQFSYRLLTQTMWLGCILFSFALLELFSKLDARHVIAGIVLLGMSCSSWLMTTDSGLTRALNFTEHPEITAGETNYLENPIELYHYGISLKNIEAAFITSHYFLKLNQPIFLPTNNFLNVPNQQLVLKGHVNKKIRLPVILTFKLGDHSVSQKIESENVEWTIPIAKFIPQTPNDFVMAQIDINTLLASEAIHIDSLRLINPESTPVLPMQTTKKYCQQHGTLIHCMIDVSTQTFVQLPIFYYDKLLKITVNGEAVSYLPSLSFQNFVLAGVKLEAGRYQIDAEFVGCGWANWVSLAGGIFLLLAGSIFLIRPYIHNHA